MTSMFERRLIGVCLSVIALSVLACCGAVMLRAARNHAIVQSLLIRDDVSVCSLYGEYKYTPPPRICGVMFLGGQRLHGFSVFGEPSDFQRPFVSVFGQHAFTNIYSVYWEDEAVTYKDL